MYKLLYKISDVAYNDFFNNICQIKSFENEGEFNSLCKKIILEWNKHVLYKYEYKDFFNIQEKIKLEGAGVIKTSWGGVFITKHEHPLVEKYLLVEKGKYLSFEKHEEKDEHLVVHEGAGILLQREEENIVVKILLPGFSTNFKPKQEHCIIATENLLIFEKSYDYKGMDQDLIFIFNPK